MFEPFSKNNVLFKQEQSIKIENNLPKIEATSTFYPFTANIVQNIYSEDSYSNESLKMVSTSQAFSDIIIATGPSDEQKEKISESKVDLEFKTIYSKMHTNNNAKIINVNNKDIKDKDYPLLFEVYLIYRTDNENISKIVNWLETEEGREFVKNIC